MSDVREARLLLALLQRRFGEAAEFARPHAPVDPARFVELCRQTDVAPWVHALLTREERLELVPPAALAALARMRAKVQRDNLLLLAHAERALDLLLAAGIVPVALKGLDFLHRVYARFDERVLDDVDLLVAPDELPRALAALEAGGWQLPPQPKLRHYVRSSHLLPLRAPDPIAIDLELHWNLAQELRFAIDGPALVRRAVEIDVAGRRILRLDDQDIVAHLLLHHFTHYFDRRLKWAVDLDALARGPGLDWQRAAERVRSWSAGTVAGFSLLHLKKMVPHWIPDEALAALPVAGWRKALTAPLGSGHPLELFRFTRARWVQLYLAGAMLEHPTLLPLWIVHRALRDRRRGMNPLEADPRRSSPGPRG